MSQTFKGDITNNVVELNLQAGANNIGTPTVAYHGTNSGEVSVQVMGDVDSSSGFQTAGSAIKGLVIGTSCTSIGSYAFSYCTGLTGSLTIPNSVTSIGSYAFYYCYDSDNDTGFSGDLVIPDSVTSIGSYSFYYCYKMEGTLTIGNSVTTIGSGAFAYNSFSGDLVIPNSVTSMGEDAFADNSNAFTGSLTLSQNPSFTAIPRRAFINTPFTGTLNIPDNITTIDFQSFGATNFSTIVIPDSITYIGTALSFSSNTGLTTVYTACPASSWDSGAINSGVGNAFSGCDNLTNIYVHADQLASYDAAWRADQSVAAGATVSTWTNYPTPTP